MLKTLVESQGGDFEKVEKYQTTIQTLSHRLPMEYLTLLGSTTVGMVSLPNLKGVDANFMYLKDYVKEFDYYSPVIIANNDYLKDNKEEARKSYPSYQKRLPIRYGASRRSS